MGHFGNIWKICGKSMVTSGKIWNIYEQAWEHRVWEHMWNYGKYMAKVWVHMGTYMVKVWENMANHGELWEHMEHIW